MDFQHHLLALLEPIGIGDEIMPGIRLEDASAELGLRLRLNAHGERLWIDVGPIHHVRRFAARSELLGFGYRTEGGRNDFDQRQGLELCRRIADIVRSNETSVMDAVAAEATKEAAPEAKIRHADVVRALDPAGLGNAHFYTINPYVGCVIGCRFCYAQSPLAAMRAMMGATEIPWGSYVEVRRNLPEVLADELERLDPLPIKFCPIVGDAYQAVEAREQVTRRCLETIAASSRDWPVIVITRSHLMMRDVELLGRIPGTWAGVSLPTAHDDVRRHFEPRAASVAERLELLAALRGAGVSTLAVVQPMMAGDPVVLADALASHVDAVVLDVLQEEEGAEHDFDSPRFRETRDEDWQRERTLLMLDLLRERGVAIWAQEIPPEYCAA